MVGRARAFWRRRACAAEASSPSSLSPVAASAAAFLPFPPPPPPPPAPDDVPRSGGAAKYGMRPRCQSWSTILAAVLRSASPPLWSRPVARASCARKSWWSAHFLILYARVTYSGLTRWSTSAMCSVASSSCGMRTTPLRTESVSVSCTRWYTTPGQSMRKTRLVSVMYCHTLVSPGMGAVLHTFFVLSVLMTELLPTLG
mmetsp:Transcript_5068/g.17617  ORF Transcript_5068/g.17617 Transcript_5068/m.17617 type:complete len:200 (-) Transcript_5068:1164-1763(-)